MNHQYASLKYYPTTKWNYDTCNPIRFQKRYTTPSSIDLSDYQIQELLNQKNIHTTNDYYQLCLYYWQTRNPNILQVIKQNNNIQTLHHKLKSQDAEMFCYLFLNQHIKNFAYGTLCTVLSIFPFIITNTKDFNLFYGINILIWIIVTLLGYYEFQNQLYMHWIYQNPKTRLKYVCHDYNCYYLYKYIAKPILKQKIPKSYKYYCLACLEHIIRTQNKKEIPKLFNKIKKEVTL